MQEVMRIAAECIAESRGASTAVTFRWANAYVRSKSQRVQG
jgi:hypothetical protein